ncbi:hypothetical protein [Hyella patelloides]|nr:hypothetical protein [Hyella patelloides]
MKSNPFSIAPTATEGQNISYMNERFNTFVTKFPGKKRVHRTGFTQLQPLTFAIALSATQSLTEQYCVT